MPDLMKQSPYGVFLDHLKKGELAYQVSEDGKAFFYPRAVAPVTGSDKLEWRVSKGLGTVYTTTVVYTKDQPPHNVVLIDVDEGFRMMSRVEDIDPLQVKIGMRVKVKMHPGDEKQPTYPVFHPLLTEEGTSRSGGGGAAGGRDHPGPSGHPSLERRGK